MDFLFRNMGNGSISRSERGMPRVSMRKPDVLSFTELLSNEVPFLIAQRSVGDHWEQWLNHAG
jgi:hypothetical protein